MRFVNQYSYVLGALLLLGSSWLIIRRINSPHRWIAFGVMLTVLAAASVTFRTGGGDVRDVADLDRALASGKPVALEFYSNY